MMKRRARQNPRTIDSDDYPEREIERFYFPFLIGIKSVPNKRIYQFRPADTREFLISIEFPIYNGADIPITVEGKPESRELTQAIEFVRRNEAQFQEALDDSRPRERYDPEIKEAVFPFAVSE